MCIIHELFFYNNKSEKYKFNFGSNFQYLDKINDLLFIRILNIKNPLHAAFFLQLP
jgi:hypothetical protein